MASVSLYRKYRPTKFNDVVGQDNVVNILQNAITSERISHAYIFNGPRGTGKTSIAKIFAKKISCVCSDDSCHFCQMNYDDGDIPDIWEIDAASNNGVDEVRRIIENISYMPIDLKYKVYIIDEVHMLTKGAFNALLKTLEEPPKHVIFILATTEIHKIPQTILSRCQRFDFKRIDEINIIKRLTSVLNEEHIEYEEKGLELIARLADGGMRDALSLVDKVITYKNVVSYENVCESLQIVGDASKDKLLNYLISNDASNTIKCFREIIASGVDETKFVIDMQYYIRDLMMDVIDGKNDEYNQNSLLNYLKLFSELDSKLMYTKNYIIVIEVYLIQMCQVTEPIYIQPKKDIIDVDEHHKKLKEQTKILKEETTKDFIKKDFEDNQILEAFAKDVVEVEFESLELPEPVEETVAIKFEKSTFMTSDFIINSNDLPVESPTIDAKPIEFDLTNLHEEYVDDSVLEFEDSYVNEPPIIEVPYVAPAVEKIDMRPNSKFDILDVLKSSTHELKNEFINEVPSIKNVLEENRQYGLAKFFDYITVNAVGTCGMVLTMNQDMYNTYEKRIEEIEKYIYNDEEKIGKIFLMENNEWITMRPKYVEQLKKPNENDIFNLAQSIFGTDIVNKI